MKPHNERCRVAKLTFVLTIVTVATLVYPTHLLASDKLLIDGSTGVKPLIAALANQYAEAADNPKVVIGEGLRPNDRIQALLDGNIDIAMASHGIDAERLYRQGLKVHKIAITAVVLGANSSVEVSNISNQQLCDIYAGQLTDWRQLGGQSLALIPLIRPFDEVDTEVINMQIPCFNKAMVPSHVAVYEKSGQMAKAIAKTPGAIGMTTLVRVAQSKGKIRALALNGVLPAARNLASGNYPLVRNMYLITAQQPTDMVTAFITFVRSPIGDKIVRQNNAAPAS